MKDGLPIKNGIIIPNHELEISSSRSGGPGGQHVQKTSSKITIRWNVNKSSALTDIQRQRILANLHNQLTIDGDLLVHSSSSRSAQQNKEAALSLLAQKVRKALHVPKKRVATQVPEGIKEHFFQKKKKRSDVKKMRRKIDWE